MTESKPDHVLPIGQCATLSCVIEATAPKPGNVHRGADFESLAYPDFLVSAMVIGPVLETAAENRLGRTVLSAVEATRQAVGTNTNLGTILLLAPLAMVPREESLREGVRKVLAELDAEDSRLVYQAIRLAQPGGMGRVDQGDLAADPPPDLIAAMRLAADRDLVARQYAGGFEEVLSCVVPWLVEALDSGLAISPAVVHLHLRLMSAFPDSLIARKCGLSVAEQAAERARRVFDSGPPESDEYRMALEDLDFWLRSDGHRRNPGTSADLMAAGLFVALRDGLIKLPLRLSDC